MATPVILNPSFELGTDPGVFLNVPNGNGAIQDWTVTGTSIDYIGTFWQHSDGVRSLDMNGVGPGGITQLVSGFTIGGFYELFFDMAGNPNNSPANKLLTVTVGNEPPAQYQFNVTGHSTASMGWQQFSFSFIADATDIQISFASNVSGNGGPALDNLSITEDLSGIPEPGSMALMGLGLTALAFIKRRR